MGNFIGACGGFLMFLLIVMLFLRFLRDLGILTNEAEFVGRIFRYGMPGLIMLLCAGIYATALNKAADPSSMQNVFPATSMLFSGIAPWNGYFSIAIAVAAFCAFHSALCRFIGRACADVVSEILALMPGIYLCFLPTLPCIMIAIVALITFSAAKLSAGTYKERPPIGAIPKLLIETILILLNGWMIIGMTGV